MNMFDAAKLNTPEEIQDFVTQLSPRDIDRFVAHLHGNEITELAYGYSPSTSWMNGGPIIEREKISLRGITAPGHNLDGMWLAQYGLFRATSMTVEWVKPLTSFARLQEGYQVGPTALIAAMRCFLVHRLRVVNLVPVELTAKRLPVVTPLSRTENAAIWMVEFPPTSKGVGKTYLVNTYPESDHIYVRTWERRKQVSELQARRLFPVIREAIKIYQEGKHG